MENKNLVYVNILKILSSIAVVVIHICAIEWYSVNPQNIKWIVLNIYSSLSRWAVPVFVMVTGVLLLSPEKNITIKEIFIKYVKRIYIVLVFWVIAFAFLSQIISAEEFNINTFINNAINSHYHLWYLYMLIGLYLITPLIKSIINLKDDKLIRYYICLWFVIQCLFYTLINLPMFSIFNAIYERMNFGFVLGYSGYYILGYYLNTNKLHKKERNIIYIIGILGSIITIVLANVLKIKYDANTAHVAYSTFSPFVFCMSISFFLLVKQIFTNINMNLKLNNLIKKVTSLSFGVYLIHPMYILFIKKLGINILVGNTFIVLPIIVVIVYLLSMLTSYILSKIPIVGRYIV